ncbi:HNH endonuclease [uncultured Brachybacterium sp.]|uniref:HNH endonuclease n=1 Tax=uncultured Brachybacterium sp. TaxID=189680 RepID=UPI00260A306C|nr:HNH endonuclease [uncultured Brachybacterium sp.]
MLPSIEDLELRNASMNWLRERTRDGELSVHYIELAEGFSFQGVRRPLKDRQRGIHSSRGFGTAWTITTTYREDGRERPYDDAPGPDGLLRYQWQGKDHDHPSNRALRNSMTQKLPMIWFWGVAPGEFRAIFPIFLVAEEQEKHQFVVDLNDQWETAAVGAESSELVKSYREGTVRQRIHQPVFRQRVIRAYETQCAICGMPRAELLDAAHIVADKEPDGIASVPNGLALCKIHHSAYDHDLLGVSPEYRVVLRDDILEASDGPVYEHGLKDAHGQSLRFLPRRRSLLPDAALLAQRFDNFLAAPVPPHRPPDILFKR